MNKPICTSSSPAPVIRDVGGYLLFNHSWIHPDAKETARSHDEGFFKKDDIVIVTRDFPTFVQFTCPHCRAVWGYNRNVFLAKELSATFWKPGEYAAHEMVYQGGL